MTTPPPTLLRLTGLKTSALPPASATADQLTPLITTLLNEALPLLESTTTTAPTLWKSKGTKHHPASTAPIDLSERVLAGETWACRRSVHADAPQPGTASWAEFARCLRDEHAATEDAFTPTVLAHREARVWAAAAEVAPVTVEGAAAAAGGGRWGGFALALVEMKHRIPPPLKPRVFPVLQLVATAVAAAGGEGELVDDFVVVSVPVGDLAEQKGEELGVLCREKGVVVGAYAAVERVRRVGGEGGEGKAKEIEWIMATASDARGVLPMFVQTKAVPAQIAKDVSLFLGWIEGERKQERPEAAGGGQQQQAAGNGQASAAV